MKSKSAKKFGREGVRLVLEGRHHDPFDVLGIHRDGDGWEVRALLPGTAQAEVVTANGRLPMERLPETDFFHVALPGESARGRGMGGPFGVPVGVHQSGLRRRSRDRTADDEGRAAGDEGGLRQRRQVQGAARHQ